MPVFLLLRLDRIAVVRGRDGWMIAQPRPA
jgi:hypothetical protein